MEESSQDSRVTPWDSLRGTEASVHRRVGEKSPARACPHGQTPRPFLKLFQDAELVVSVEKGLKTGFYLRRRSRHFRN